MILATIIKTIDPFMEMMNKIFTAVGRLWLHMVGGSLLGAFLFGLVGLVVGFPHLTLAGSFIGMILGAANWFQETFGKSESETNELSEDYNSALEEVREKLNTNGEK